LGSTEPFADVFIGFKMFARDYYLFLLLLPPPPLVMRLQMAFGMRKHKTPLLIAPQRAAELETHLDGQILWTLT
jgi:hypothetical protein